MSLVHGSLYINKTGTIQLVQHTKFEGTGCFKLCSKVERIMHTLVCSYISKTILKKELSNFSYPVSLTILVKNFHP